MKLSESIVEISKALSKFQGEITNPENTKAVRGEKFGYKYAPLNDVLNHIREPMEKNGLSLTQHPIYQEDKIGIITLLLHSSGEYIEYPALVLPLDKNTAQGAGSAITYARRYALSAVLGISSEDDNDANSLSSNKNRNNLLDDNTTKKDNFVRKLTKAQINRLFVIANNIKLTEEKVREQIFKEFNKKVEDLNIDEYNRVCNAYNKKFIDSKS